MATQRLLSAVDNGGLDDTELPPRGWLSTVCCCFCKRRGAVDEDDDEESEGAPSPPQPPPARGTAAEAPLLPPVRAPRAPLPPSVRSGGRRGGDAAAAAAVLPKPPGWRAPSAGSSGAWPPATRSSSAPFTAPPPSSSAGGVASPPPLPPPLPRPCSFGALSGSAGSGPPVAHADDDCCPTCLEEWSGDNPAVPLPGCGHAFHLACVLEWSQRASSCPVCGATVDVEAVLAGDDDGALTADDSAIFHDAQSAVATDSDAGEDDAVYSSAATRYRRE